MDQLKPGLTGTAELIVGAEHIATHFGSGLVDVFATPMMIALMETAAVDAVEARLSEGLNTVGIHLDVSHTAATPRGMRVVATAELVKIEKRKLSFSIRAEDEDGLIGDGTHERVVVDAASFMARVDDKAQRER